MSYRWFLLCINQPIISPKNKLFFASFILPWAYHKTCVFDFDANARKKSKMKKNRAFGIVFYEMQTKIISLKATRHKLSNTISHKTKMVLDNNLIFLGGAMNYCPLERPCKLMYRICLAWKKKNASNLGSSLGHALGFVLKVWCEKAEWHDFDQEKSRLFLITWCNSRYALCHFRHCSSNDGVELPVVNRDANKIYINSINVI